MEKFQIEQASPELFEEMLPLLNLHYASVAHYQDIEFAPDYASYLKLAEMGALRIFTAREEKSGVMIGYAVFFVRQNLHYKNSLQAVQDILFIHPEARGFGARFITWCEDILRAHGVQAVYHHVKAKPELNFSPLLERLDYELVDLIWAKRLDKGGA